MAIDQMMDQTNEPNPVSNQQVQVNSAISAVEGFNENHHVQVNRNFTPAAQSILTEDSDNTDEGSSPGGMCSHISSHCVTFPAHLSAEKSNIGLQTGQNTASDLSNPTRPVQSSANGSATKSTNCDVEYGHPNRGTSSEWIQINDVLKLSVSTDKI